MWLRGVFEWAELKKEQNRFLLTAKRRMIQRFQYLRNGRVVRIKIQHGKLRRYAVASYHLGERNLEIDRTVRSTISKEMIGTSNKERSWMFLKRISFLGNLLHNKRYVSDHSRFLPG